MQPFGHFTFLKLEIFSGFFLSGQVSVRHGRFNMKSIVLIIIVTAVSLLGGCGNSDTAPSAPDGINPGVTTSNINKTSEPQVPTPAAWINIPSLAGKTPDEIERTVGKSLRTVPVTEPPQEVPGENRSYDLAGMKDALSIRFYKGKAVAFTLNVPPGKELKTAEELGKLAGFELAGKTPAKATDFVSQWNGQFGPAKFAEVSIGKSAKTDYNLVRARIQQ